MIGRLAGRIVDQEADGTVVLDVHGVGYELTVPLGTVGRAAPDPEGVVTLHVHTHVREDAFLLYGFASPEERAVFRQLIAVSNVGPKMALNILGALAVADLSAAIARGETARLTKVPGIGKKTAERLVLELKDKLLVAPSALPAPGPGPKVAPVTAKGELLHGALTRMGFRPAEAERAVASLGSRVETDPMGELVRDALAALSPR